MLTRIRHALLCVLLTGCAPLMAEIQPVRRVVPPSFPAPQTSLLLVGEPVREFRGVAVVLEPDGPAERLGQFLHATRTWADSLVAAFNFHQETLGEAEALRARIAELEARRQSLRSALASGEERETVESDLAIVEDELRTARATLAGFDAAFPARCKDAKKILVTRTSAAAERKRALRELPGRVYPEFRVRLEQKGSSLVVVEVFFGEDGPSLLGCVDGISQVECPADVSRARRTPMSWVALDAFENRLVFAAPAKDGTEMEFELFYDTYAGRLPFQSGRIEMKRDRSGVGMISFLLDAALADELDFVSEGSAALRERCGAAL